MTADRCAEARLSLGAYVLGALDPAERGRVDAHLAGCPDCRDELASFAALPGLLGRVSRAEAEAAMPAPSPELLDRLLYAAAGERRRDRRVRWLTSVAAAVVAVAAVVVGFGVSQTHHHSVQAITGDSRTFAATDPVTHVTATVKEVQKGWGATVQVSVTGVSAGSYGGALQCQLVAIGADGRTDIAGSWAAPAPGHSVEAIGATALPASDIKAFKIVGSDGTSLVTIPAQWDAKA